MCTRNVLIPFKSRTRSFYPYVTDGEPIPTFVGEPERIEIPDCIDCFTNEIWDNLDENNKISLYVRMTDLTTGEIEERLINKHTL